MAMQRCVSVVFPIPFNRIFHYLLPGELDSGRLVGRRVVAPFAARGRIGYIVDSLTKVEIKGLKAITEVIDKQPLISTNLLELARWISRYYVCSLGQALDIILPHNFRPVIAREKIKQERAKILSAFIPSPQQNRILKPIQNNIKEKEFNVFLIHGVTDSGKTEVYLQAIAQAQEVGRQSIFLVPEISLTPQFLSIFEQRFGASRIGLWHSRLSQGERYRTWQSAYQGKIDIMIGARSAIFAPLPDLGLIIIDEEHDTSYKQEKRPLYHTRELAEKRAELEKATLVLGSATPSLEAFYRAKTRGKPYTLLTLPERIYERSLPSVYIVDMRAELKERNNPRIFSAKLSQAIGERLEKGEQIILFLNRRGHSTFILCRECGFVLKCPNCSVSMVYHFNEKRIKCHYCNHNDEPPRFCPRCGSKKIRYFGTGTEKVEQLVNKMFPRAKVMRMDFDTMHYKHSADKIFNAFRKRKVDILVGTQLVAKGWDFPFVTLVGIISADTALNLPDFRSAERTFSLITQVAGRSGRGMKKGEVIVQTYNPEHYSIQMALEHNYCSFYEKEMEFRRELNYPPLTNLIIILVKGEDEQKVISASEKITSLLKREINRATIMGPAPAVLNKIAGKYRWQIIIKTSDMEYIGEFFQRHQLGLEWKGVEITVDVDPISML
jgi:primosomal protein N' (replication factor Y)